MIRKISFIGSGNVASHMATALYKQGYEIINIWSRNLNNAVSLSHKVKAVPLDNISQLDKKTDLYIIAIPDDQIVTMAKQLQKQLARRARIVHTSGATSVASVSEYFKMAGVIWPLQSLSKGKKVSFKKLPLCITSTSPTLKKELLILCQSLSDQVQVISDDQKRILHLAAVFANNFSNHMYSIAHDLCTEHEIDFKLLQPLITETARKVTDQSPADMQTGPAIRGDHKSMELHQKQLKKEKDILKLYQLISTNIQKQKP